MGDEMVPIGMGELAVVRTPAEKLAKAREAAVALKEVIQAKPKPVIFNNEQYIEFEDWQLIAHFYGVTSKVTGTEYVTFGDVLGFTASADAIDVATGHVLSSAESMCLNDEDKWSSKPKYEWHYVRKSDGKLVAEDPGPAELIWEQIDGKNRPKKERVRVGDDRVPLFQLKSMAQTRAQAKVLANIFRYVVVLAGFKATPAEEMTGHRGEVSSNGHAVQPREDGSAIVVGIESKSGTSAAGRPWTKYTVMFDDGRQVGTFDEVLAKAAQAAKDAGVFVIPTIVENGQHKNLTGLADVDAGWETDADSGTITEAQTRKFWAIARGANLDDAAIGQLLVKHGALAADAVLPMEQAVAQIPAARFDGIIQDLKTKAV